jgi:hypothetical protein
MATRYSTVVNPFTGDLDMVALPTLVPVNYALASLGNTGATETDIVTVNVPANFQQFNASGIGQVIEVDAGGSVLQALTTNTRRFRVYVGGAASTRGPLILDTGAINVSANSTWSLKIRVYNNTNGVGNGSLKVAAELFCPGFTATSVLAYSTASTTLSSVWSIIVSAQSGGTTASNQTVREWMKAYYIGT